MIHSPEIVVAALIHRVTSIKRWIRQHVITHEGSGNGIKRRNGTVLSLRIG